jgi:Topoisomerase DNA binding C4 zinc finger
MIETQPCPRCGSPMAERRNRQTGDAFLGCTRYPACRGTRPVATTGPSSRPGTGASPRVGSSGPGRRHRLSHGGRPKGWGDDVELIVARLVGRDLKPWEGCVVQLSALAIVGLFCWWLFASGTILVLIRPFVDWYASQVHPGPIASPTG